MKYEVFSLDVWGNAEDGFEVNDLFRIDTIELPEAATDDQILAALEESGNINAGSSPLANVDDPGDGDLITIEQKSDGRPVLQLRRVEP